MAHKTRQQRGPAAEPADGPDLYVIARYRTGEDLPYGICGTAGGRVHGGLDLAHSMLNDGLARIRAWSADPREGQDIPDRLALIAVDLPGLPAQPTTPPSNADFSEPPEWTAWNAAMKEILEHPERWVIRETIAKAAVAETPQG